MSEKAKLFISYSWSTKEIAEKIYNDLTLVGLEVLKDNHELKYTDRISDFMKSIKRTDYALLIINDGYLKSKNCMIEVLEHLKIDSAWDKTLPVVFSDTNIYTTLDRIYYINYWESQTRKISEALNSIDPINATEIYRDFKQHQDITANIDSFMLNISDRLHITPEKLFKDNYKQIISKIGVKNDQEPLIKLLEIVLISNMESREIALEEYIKSYPESAYYYSIKAGTARNLRKFKQARYFYEKALELDGFNYEALNNLGQLYEHIYKEFDKARICYKKAIKSNPKLDIPRLNLGVLLSNHFKDITGAKKVYEELLEIEPDNAKAHNNISNIYKSDIFRDLSKAEFHIKKAIEINPNYIEAYLNYGNFLKVYKRNIEKGNSYYMKVKELDKDGLYKEIIDMLIKSTKG
jgi:tetratricopeptide (TPR) repeat protein